MRSVAESETDGKPLKIETDEVWVSERVLNFADGTRVSAVIGVRQSEIEAQLLEKRFLGQLASMGEANGGHAKGVLMLLGIVGVETRHQRAPVEEARIARPDSRILRA